jgi:hypothetical protein
MYDGHDVHETSGITVTHSMMARIDEALNVES